MKLQWQVNDQMANGRRFRILNIVDDVTRECLAAIPDQQQLLQVRFLSATP